MVNVGLPPVFLRWGRRQKIVLQLEQKVCQLISEKNG